MRRKGTVGVALGVLLTIGLLPFADGELSGIAGASHVRPNVVVVMTDDQTVESMRAMPQSRALLGDRGTTFANSFVNFPLCCPSRATLFTGQYAHNHGVVSGFGFEDLDPSNTLPLWLRDAGYTTAHVGKYLNGYGHKDPNLVPPGWSEWYGIVPPDQAVYEYDVNENGDLVHYGSAPEDFKGDVITGKAVDFISRRAPAPGPLLL
jgi:N-acetylglucosamine-6-sulfatase